MSWSSARSITSQKYGARAARPWHPRNPRNPSAGCGDSEVVRGPALRRGETRGVRPIIPELPEPTFSRRRVHRIIATLLWVSIPVTLLLLIGAMMPSMQMWQNSR